VECGLQMKLYAELNQVGEKRAKNGTTFSAPNSFVSYSLSHGAAIKDDKFVFKIDSFFCRDQLMPALGHLLADYYSHDGYELSARDKNLAFRPYNHWDEDGRTDQVLEYSRYALLGETNEDFSPMASPYFVRWLIGRVRGWDRRPRGRQEKILALTPQDTLEKVRQTLSYRDFLWRAMREADPAEVRLNENFREAWNLDNVAYAYMGLNALRDNLQPWAFDTATTRPYDVWFPPQQFMDNRKV